MQVHFKVLHPIYWQSDQETDTCIVLQNSQSVFLWLPLHTLIAVLESGWKHDILFKITTNHYLQAYHVLTTLLWDHALSDCSLTTLFRQEQTNYDFTFAKIKKLVK